MFDENDFKMITEKSKANRPLQVINFFPLCFLNFYRGINLRFDMVSCASILNNCCDIGQTIYV